MVERQLPKLNVVGSNPISRSIAGQTLRTLHRLARRLARASEEADDLVQDALLAALEQKRDWDDGGFLAWTSGVIRHRALFLARTAGRRRRRDTSFVAETSALAPPPPRLPGPFIESLPPSLRSVAQLGNAGLGRGEIAHLLDVPDTALRKRISDLRRAWSESGDDAELSPPGPPHRPPCGLLRRSLKTALCELPAARFAMADPDGHQIFLGIAHKRPRHGN